MFLLLMLAAYAAGAVTALALPPARGRRPAAACLALGALAGAVAGARVVITGQPVGWELPSSLPGLALLLELDPLGGFFLCLIGLVVLPAAIYAPDYLASPAAPDAAGGAHAADGGRVAGALTALFILSMSLVVAAGNVFTFLLCWEGMAVCSLLLVVGDGATEERRGAGRWYAGMAHAGFLLIAACLLLLAARTSGGAFADIRGASYGLGTGARNAMFLMALFGFGSKAGLVPLQGWLPRAHPAAPSHVSALMSGAMLKLGLYGFLRVVFDLLGGGPPWWGGLALALGIISALYGVLYALLERDLKRLLAYSSIENLGLIFMGAGLGLVFHGAGRGDLAALALLASLFHAFNHAAFKGLLFMGAGSVVRATGTRDLEAMGGLIKRMPWTAACTLVGAMAIAALPPLNGFASEWLLFQSLMAGVGVAGPLFAVAMAMSVGALALTGGLAAACFVKAFGITFLALPRGRAAAEAAESPRLMRLAMLIPAAACVLLGILAPSFGRFTAAALAAVPWLDPSSASFRLDAGFEVRDGFGRIAPAVLALLLLGSAAAAWGAVRLLASRRRRVGETWGCGRIGQTSRMEYTAAAFAEPLLRVFGDLLRPTRDLTIEFHPESKYFVRSIGYRTRVRAWLEEDLAGAIRRLLRPLGGSGRLIQSGSVHLYIAYVFAALLAFLLLARWM